MGYRQTVAAAVLLAAALAAYAATPATAHKFYINWLVHMNYTNWSRNNGPIYKGDLLMFYVPETYLEVVQVNKRGFDMCDPRNPIYRSPGGRNIYIPLSEAKVYYFICSVQRHCPQGMRLAVDVRERSPTPASARDDTLGATSPAPGPRASSEGKREGQALAGGSDDSVPLLGGMSGRRQRYKRMG